MNEAIEIVSIIIKIVFHICVDLMIEISQATGISYEAINIWLFVILQPALILLYMGKYYRLKNRLKRTT